MAKPPSLDKLVLDGLMSRDEPQIAAAIEQAGALGWRLPQVRKALTDFLDPLLDAGSLEEWPELDIPSVLGPRLECEAGTVPLVRVFQRLPAVVTYLPWLPGRRARFSLFCSTDPFHNLSEKQYEEIQRRGPIWELSERTNDWGRASTALMETAGDLAEERDLQFDDYFGDDSHFGKALLAQAADAGNFLLGAQMEFEGNHNDAEFAVLMARLEDEPAKKPRRRKP